MTLIRRVTITNRDGIPIELALFPQIAPCIKGGEGLVLDIPTPIEPIRLTVEDVCQIVKALRSEKAINDNVEPTPHLQRAHWATRNQSI